MYVKMFKYYDYKHLSHALLCLQMFRQSCLRGQSVSQFPSDDGSGCWDLIDSHSSADRYHSLTGPQVKKKEACRPLSVSTKSNLTFLKRFRVSF